MILTEQVDFKALQKGKSPVSAGKNKKQQVIEEEIDSEVPSDLDEIIAGGEGEEDDEEIGEDDELLEGEEELEGEEGEFDDEDLLEGEAEDEFEEEGMQRPPGVLPIGYGITPAPEDEIIPADEVEGGNVKFYCYGKRF